VKSSSLHIDKRRRTYVRLLGAIQHALLEALDEEHLRRGLTRAEVARLIGRNKSFVTRKLTGEGNMTLQSLADLAFALDRSVKVTLPAQMTVAGTNRTITPATSQNLDITEPKATPTTSAEISAIAA
jgi:transcriptional regulator with XRE-family HTH domain